MLKRSCYIAMKNCVGQTVGQNFNAIMEHCKDKMEHYDDYMAYYEIIL